MVPTTYAKDQLVVVPSEVVMVNRFGVTPTKIVRPPGPFVLFVENRLPGHTEHYSLTLDQDGAAEFAGMDTKSDKLRNSTLLDLLPGKYRVRFRNRAEFSVAIEIQAK
jgi:hypothetical protein